MKPFTLISKRALAVLGAGAITLGTLGALGITPLPTAASSPPPAATSTPFAGPPAWAGHPGAAGFAGQWNGAGQAGVSQAVATLLGMTPDQIHAERLAGKSLADIAQSKGVRTDKLVATIVATAKEHLATLVKDGTVTQQQADQMLQTITTQVTAMVQSSGPMTGPGMMGHGFGPGMMGSWGGGAAPTASQTPSA